MKYYPLSSKPALPPEVSDLSGVYIIHALDDSRKPQIINRVLGEDKSGTLYIGQSTDQGLLIRINFFRRVARPDRKATAHSGGLNLKEIEALRNRFPITSLFVSVYPSSTAKILEKKLIEEYRQKYGEVPPLNSNK